MSLYISKGHVSVTVIWDQTPTTPDRCHSPDRFTVLRTWGLCCTACVKVTLRYASMHNKTQLTLSHGDTWIAQYSIELQSPMRDIASPLTQVHMCTEKSVFQSKSEAFLLEPVEKRNNLPCVWWEGCVKGQLQSLCNLEKKKKKWQNYKIILHAKTTAPWSVTIQWLKLHSDLVFNGDLCAQGVVSIPLLCEGQTILRSLVFGFQAAHHFAGVSVGGTRGLKFLKRQEREIFQIIFRENAFCFIK